MAVTWPAPRPPTRSRSGRPRPSAARRPTDRSERQRRIQTYTAPDGTRTTVSTDPSGQHAVALPDGTTIRLGSQADPRWGMDAPIATPVDETRPDGVVPHTTTAVDRHDPARRPARRQRLVAYRHVADGTWPRRRTPPRARSRGPTRPAGRPPRRTIRRGAWSRRRRRAEPDLAVAYDDPAGLPRAPPGAAPPRPRPPTPTTGRTRRSPGRTVPSSTSAWTPSGRSSADRRRRVHGALRLRRARAAGPGRTGRGAVHDDRVQRRRPSDRVPASDHRRRRLLRGADLRPGRQARGRSRTGRPLDRLRHDRRAGSAAGRSTRARRPPSTIRRPASWSKAAAPGGIGTEIS